MDKKDVLERLQKICSNSEKCISDVKNKMNEWNFKGDEQSIIDALIKGKFIDESRFSIAFAHDKYSLAKWGKFKIEYALRIKNIPGEIIREAMTGIDEEEYNNMVFNELSKRWDSIKIPQRRKHGVFSFGAQRGYDKELIYRWLNNKENN